MFIKDTSLMSKPFSGRQNKWSKRSTLNLMNGIAQFLIFSCFLNAEDKEEEQLGIKYPHIHMYLSDWPS